MAEQPAELAPAGNSNKKVLFQGWEAKLMGMNGSLILSVPDWAGAVPGVNDKLDALAKNENLEFKRPNALKVWSPATFE